MKKKMYVKRTVATVLCAACLVGGIGFVPAKEVSAATTVSGIEKDLFDWKYYADMNPDVYAAYGYDKEKLYYHYANAGVYEGRAARYARGDISRFITEINFDALAYAAYYPDIKAAYGTDVKAIYNHYVNAGKYEGRIPFSKEPATNALCQIYAVAKQITNDNMSDFEKVKAVHDWICENMAYDYSYERHHYWEAMEDHLIVCSGYSDLFEEFMNVLNITSVQVYGKVYKSTGEGSHAWNKVVIDGKWYNIDVCWDDESDGYNYEYFLLGDAAISRNHKEESIEYTSTKLPSAPATYNSSICGSTYNATRTYDSMYEAYNDNYLEETRAWMTAEGRAIQSETTFVASNGVVINTIVADGAAAIQFQNAVGAEDTDAAYQEYVSIYGEL